MWLLCEPISLLPVHMLSLDMHHSLETSGEQMCNYSIPFHRVYSVKQTELTKTDNPIDEDENIGFEQIK